MRLWGQGPAFTWPPAQCTFLKSDIQRLLDLGIQVLIALHIVCSLRARMCPTLSVAPAVPSTGPATEKVLLCLMNKGVSSLIASAHHVRAAAKNTIRSDSIHLCCVVTVN